MTGAGLLYANSSTVAGADGVWIAVADGDGLLLAHEHLVGHSDLEYIALLAVKLAAGLLRDSDVARGAVITDSTLTVCAVQRRGGEPPRTESARRRTELAGEILAMLGVGWVVAWAPRDVNLAHSALAAHLATTTPTTEAL